MSKKGIDFLPSDLLGKIKQIEISTKRLLKSISPGSNRSNQKGAGFDFDQIREYQMGDDVRCIDWLGSARSGVLLTKHYVQEISRCVFIAVDVSRSTVFSSGEMCKSDSIIQAAAVLSLIAEYNNDEIGLLLFSNKVELYVPPRKGMNHVHNLMSILCTYKSKGVSTDFDAVFKKLVGLKRKDMLVFLISDFIGEMQSVYCETIARLYSLIAIRCLDKNENVIFCKHFYGGFVSMVDIETGEMVTVNTRNNKGKLEDVLQARINEQSMFFKRRGINVLDIATDRPFISDMVRFFKRCV